MMIREVLLGTGTLLVGATVGWLAGRWHAKRGINRSLQRRWCDLSPEMREELQAIPASWDAEIELPTESRLVANKFKLVTNLREWRGTRWSK